MAPCWLMLSVDEIVCLRIISKIPTNPQRQITTQKKYIENYTSIIKRLKLNIENYIPSPLSTSLAALTSDEKDPGLILQHKNFTSYNVGDGHIRTWIFKNLKASSKLKVPKIFVLIKFFGPSIDLST